MRKYLIITLLLLSSASCKKDYTCTCRTVNDSNGQEISSSSRTITDYRNDARSECDSDDLSGFGYTQNCEI